jgi:acetyl-CoA carboxylase biotin carboxylase subunit
VRDDSGAYQGCTISGNYDPLISKLSVWAPDRERAVQRMRRALGEYVVSGIRTNLPFHERLFEQPEFVAGDYDTSFIDRHKDELLKGSRIPAQDKARFAAAVAVAAYRAERHHRSENGAPKPGGTSPWVAQHRARLGRGPRA